MTEQEAIAEAKAIVRKYQLVKGYGQSWINTSDVAKMYALLEKQSNIDLLEDTLGNDGIYVVTYKILNTKLNNLKQVKAKIELL